MTRRLDDARVLDFMQQQQNALQQLAPGITRHARTAQPGKLPQRPGPQLWTPPRGRSDCLMIAAANARPDELEQADVTCDGVDDQVQISAALAELDGGGPNGDLYGGTVLLSTGDFYVSEPIVQPGYTSLLGVDKDATDIHALSCHAVTVTDVARIGRITFNNDDDDSTIDAIRAEPTDNVIWLIGSIFDCWFFGFGTDINLYSSGWQIDFNYFWNVQAAFTPYGVKIHNHPSSGITNPGGNFIRHNHFVDGHGIFIGDADPTENKILDNTFFNDPEHVSLQLDNDDNHVLWNDFDTGQVIVAGHDNRLSNNRGGFGSGTSPYGWQISGDRNVIQDTMDAGRIQMAATADNTRIWGNDFAAISDLGTNTKRNLDGSANDWNW